MQVVKKKKILAGILSAGLLLSLAAEGMTTMAVAQENTESAQLEQESDGTEAGLYSPGTYTSSAQGFGGTVTVQMTFDADTVTEVEIEGSDETAEVGGAALETLAAQLLEANSAEIDGVSGATYTSSAVKTAAAECIAQAAGTAEEKMDSLVYEAGTYTSVQTGHGGNVTVEVTFSENEITEINVVDESETSGICEKALYTDLPESILENQSLTVDSISGATLSSNALKQAVYDCAEQAGANAELLYQSAEEDTGNEADAVENDTTDDTAAATELTADVVIVGAGGAGLAAAVSAIQEGSSVILIEKAGYAGGNSLVNGGIYNAPNPDLQESVEMTDSARSTIEEALAEEPISEEHAELIAAVQAEYDEYLESGATYLFDSVNWYALQTWRGGDYLADLDLVMTMAENAYDCLQWLYDLGWETDGTIITGAGALYQRTVSSTEPLGFGMIDAYLENLEGEDCTFLFNTTAEHLLTEDGAVVGVSATNTDDETITVYANNGVILSTGGFSANSEMVEEYNTSGKWPDLSSLGTTNISTAATGDGITMALEAGASLTDMDQIQLLYLCDPDYNGETSRNDPKGIDAAGQLFFNLEGERFVNETGRRDEISLAVLEQTDQVYWLVTCADILTDPDNTTDYSGTPLATLIEEGRVVSADTFEELCEKIGIPVETASAALQAYNENAEAGASSDEYGRTSFVSMTNGPWYAALNTVSVHHTMGGITIDTECHVLDESGEIIEGLYAAGEVTGGIHGSNRLGGNAIVDTVVFGRIAGKSAATD